MFTLRSSAEIKRELQELADEKGIDPLDYQVFAVRRLQAELAEAKKREKSDGSSAW